MFTPDTTSPLYSVILMRHGESVGNAKGLHQGQTDFPLNDTGRRQTRALLRRWKHERRTFNLILTSPLKRALETAELLSEGLRVQVEVDPLLMERDNGLLSGLRPEDGEQIAPRPAFMHPYLPVGEVGESQWSLYIRASQALGNLLSRPPGSYLVISHGGILNLVMYAILGIPLQANFTGPRFRFGNTAFASLTYRPNEHKWTVFSVNDQAHWKESRL